jgi:hypothetical protein
MLPGYTGFLVVRIDCDTHDRGQEEQGDQEKERNRKTGNMAADHPVSVGWIDGLVGVPHVASLVFHFGSDIVYHCAGLGLYRLICAFSDTHASTSGRLRRPTEILMRIR